MRGETMISTPELKNKKEPDVMVIDIDGTLYDKKKYIHFIEQSKQIEITLLSTMLKIPHREFIQLLEQQKTSLNINSDINAILHMGIRFDQWTQVRISSTWISQLKKNTKLTNAIVNFPGIIVFASNCPRCIAERILRLFNLEKFQLFTYESIGFIKPNPEFFIKIARLLGKNPSQLISIGNNLEHDCLAAQLAGFQQTVLVNGPLDVIKHLKGYQLKTNTSNITSNIISVL